MTHSLVLIALGCSMICVCLKCYSKRKNRTISTLYRPLQTNSNSSQTSSSESSASDSSTTNSSSDENSVRKVRTSTNRMKKRELKKVTETKLKKPQRLKVSHSKATYRRAPVHTKTHKANSSQISENDCHHFVHHHIHHSKPDYPESIQLADALQLAREHNLKQSSSVLQPRTAYTRHFCGRCNRVLDAIVSTFFNKKRNYESHLICPSCGQRLVNRLKMHDSKKDCYADYRKKVRNHRCTCYLRTKFEGEFCSFCSARMQRSAEFFNNYLSRQKSNHCLLELANSREDIVNQQTEGESKRKVNEHEENEMILTKDDDNYLNNLKQNLSNQTKLVSMPPNSIKSDLKGTNHSQENSVSDDSEDETAEKELTNLRDDIKDRKRIQTGQYILKNQSKFNNDADNFINLRNSSDYIFHDQQCVGQCDKEICEQRDANKIANSSANQIDDSNINQLSSLDRHPINQLNCVKLNHIDFYNQTRKLTHQSHIQNKDSLSDLDNLHLNRLQNNKIRLLNLSTTKLFNFQPPKQTKIDESQFIGQLSYFSTHSPLYDRPLDGHQRKKLCNLNTITKSENLNDGIESLKARNSNKKANERDMNFKKSGAKDENETGNLGRHRTRLNIPLKEHRKIMTELETKALDRIKCLRKQQQSHFQL